MANPGASRQGAVDYLSFLRGYVAALNNDDADLAGQPPAYAEGFAVAAQPVQHTRRYQDYSVTRSAGWAAAGSFSGTLTELLRQRSS